MALVGVGAGVATLAGAPMTGNFGSAPPVGSAGGGDCSASIIRIIALRAGKCGAATFGSAPSASGAGGGGNCGPVLPGGGVGCACDSAPTAGTFGATR